MAIKVLITTETTIDMTLDGYCSLLSDVMSVPKESVEAFRRGETAHAQTTNDYGFTDKTQFRLLHADEEPAAVESEASEP